MPAANSLARSRRCEFYPWYLFTVLYLVRGKVPESDISNIFGEPSELGLKEALLKCF
jgi:hypothetical protein